MAIVELCVDPRNPFPADVLAIAAATPALNTPVYAVGHPQALPLKYVSHTANALTQPHITGPTGVHAWGIAPSCITADLDKFGGMSGGPLFAVGSNEVIGIGRSGAKSSSRPMPPDVLQNDEQNWRTESVRQLYVIISNKYGNPIAPPATPLLPAEFFYNFGNYQYHRALDHFTVLQNLPTDPAITLRNAWNRVDTYRAFTLPLADFLSTPNRRICVVVSLDVSCTFELDAIPIEMEFDHNPQPLPFCERNYAQRGSADIDCANYHFEWQGDFGVAADLDGTAAPWSAVTGLPRGAMQGPAFRSPKGLMGWNKIHVPFAPQLFKGKNDRVVNISGNIEVTFGYEHAVQENALQFKVDLDFPLPRDNKSWVGLIGEYPVRYANGQEISFRTQGFAWTGPWPGASLPIVQRPMLQTIVAQNIAQIQTSASLAINPAGP
ncbi:Hypothetical protein D9617_14g077710 [Elsinoe fawcettii]|nr:Hypothetical protein D9617_14g077710 [Elsinoe fawcettii]